MDCLEFIHITKTGGTSIEDWGYKNNILWSYRKREYFKNFKHRGLNNSSSKWHIPPDFFFENPYKNKVTFTCVRNPYTRIISEYYCPWVGCKNNIYDKNNFNKWINNLLMKNDIVSGLPQHLYNPFDYVLHFESLQNDFTKMIREFDTSCDTTLAHSNKSKILTNKFTVDDIDKNNIELINKKYARDFELFGYNKLKL